MKKLILLILIAGLLFTKYGLGQNKTTTERDSAKWKSIESVKTIDGILDKMLKIINRENGEQCDTATFRKLFLPTAHFTVHMHSDSFPRPIETVSLDEFIELISDPYYGEGFEEKELNKIVDVYNDIAHVFQVYRVRDSDGIEETGLNSFQLIYFKERWWIVSVMWTGNSNGVQVPKKYLK